MESKTGFKIFLLKKAENGEYKTALCIEKGLTRVSRVSPFVCMEFGERKDGRL